MPGNLAMPFTHPILVFGHLEGENGHIEAILGLLGVNSEVQKGVVIDAEGMIVGEQKGAGEGPLRALLRKAGLGEDEPPVRE